MDLMLLAPSHTTGLPSPMMQGRNGMGAGQRLELGSVSGRWSDGSASGAWPASYGWSAVLNLVSMVKGQPWKVYDRESPWFMSVKVRGQVRALQSHGFPVLGVTVIEMAMDGFTSLWVVPGSADPLPVPRVQWVEDDGTDVVPERDPSLSEVYVEYPPKDPVERAAWEANLELERQAHLASLPELDAS